MPEEAPLQTTLFSKSIFSVCKHLFVLVNHLLLCSALLIHANHSRIGSLHTEPTVGIVFTGRNECSARENLVAALFSYPCAKLIFFHYPHVFFKTIEDLKKS